MKYILAFALSVVAVPRLALAQELGQEGRERAATSTALPQPETVRGTVGRFTPCANGDLDGFLLEDGTEVHVAPYLSARLTMMLRAGDPVQVRGQKATGAAFIRADSLTALNDNQ